MKRNGKDIQEQVGDMSRNHLVHQRNAAMESNNLGIRRMSCRSILGLRKPRPRRQILLSSVGRLGVGKRRRCMNWVSMCSRPYGFQRG
ncbi:Protein of unknown function [Pyronema omphalodes CBS 100304]|uniref:Uncharacterized protein n=1 Tax=Pyronema omphalodes (strain CBS 100304) TaxID=1076935 RepID=U4KW91_PYROM|nr:Protein of unknown function [Pyronema omphalodes CBS 100304]